MIVRRLDSSELDRLQPLFERVFKHPISLELLQWKYAKGRGESWTAWQARNTTPFLHCGLFFRNVLLCGEPIRAAQLVDLMAGPKHTGLSREQSPFTVLMRQMLDCLPSPDNRDGVAFGFPSDRAMRLGEHSGISYAVDRWLELEFHRTKVKSGSRIRPWRPDLTSDLALANRLWREMAHDFVDFSLGVHDSEHLIHRYIERPEKKYSLCVIESRWLRLPIGIAVVGSGQTHQEILDIIGRWEDMPEIILALQRWQLEKQGPSLKLMLTSHFAQQLEPYANQCSETQFRIMANPRTPEVTLSKLRNRWWLTGGDTDYR